MQQRSRPGGSPARGGSRVTGTPRNAGARGRTGGRAPSRPEVPRRPAGQVGTAKRLRAPEPRRLTGRAMVLGLVLLSLLLAYAYPVRVYLAQQAEIDQMQGSQASQSERIEQLNLEAAKWNDNEYVKSQARKRLHMVMPGEKPLIVVDPNNADPSGSGTAPAGGTSGPKPWYGKLWSSVEAANSYPHG
jgi:cell division protein FtsB